MTGWIVPIVLWGAAIVGARGWMLRFGLLRCRVGDWGLALVLGYTAYTGSLYLLALAGVPLGAPLCVAAVLPLGAGIVAGRGRSYPPRTGPEPWTPAERVVLVALAVYAWFAIVNGLYHPVTATDAFSYAGRARFMAVDRTLDIARYHWGDGLDLGSNLTYPPLHSLAFAVTYVFGGWQPKLVTVLFSLGWPWLLYDPLRRVLPRFSALLWVLVLALTPEVYSHLSYALLNVPAMALILGETVCLARAVPGQERSWFVPAAVCAAGACGVRSDALLPHLAVVVTAVGFLLAKRSALRAGLPGLAAVAAAPLLTWGTWSVYLHDAIGITEGSPFQGHRIGWAIMFDAAAHIGTSFYTYGPVFFLWLVSLPVVLLTRSRDREAMFYQTTAALVLVSLIGLYANLGVGFGGGPEDVINSSFKRALFYLVPPAGLAAGLSPPWRSLARRGLHWVHEGAPATRRSPA